MILNGFPDVAPRPLTEGNRAFRENFYARWGKENALVVGHAQRAEFAPFTQCLSIKHCWDGHEDYLTERQRLRVGHGHFLVLNAGQTYGAQIDNPTPVTSMAIFFRPGMAEEWQAAALQTATQALASEHALLRRPRTFAQHLRPCDPLWDTRLRHLHDAVQTGETESAWLEEQLWGLLHLLGQSEDHYQRRSLALASMSRSAHQELLERVDSATDYLLSSFAQPLDLDALAQVARLSKFHLLRAFTQVHGTTPFAFLSQLRVRHAKRLLQSSAQDLDAIAIASGLGTRHTLIRQVRKHLGCTPSSLRKTQGEFRSTKLLTYS